MDFIIRGLVELFLLYLRRENGTILQRKNNLKVF